MGPASNSGTTEMDQVSHQGAAPAVSAQQEALFDFAVSQSSAIFYIAEFGGDRRLRYISSNVEAITGHCAASFLDDSDFGPMQTHPDDRSAYSSALANLRKEGVASCEYRFGGADGTYRWYRDEIRLIGEEEVDSARYIGCMMLEAQRIAVRLGVHFRVDVERRINGAAGVGAHRTSMLQDLERGRQIEVDALLTVVQEMGRMVDVECPHIDSVLALIQQLGRTQGLYPTFPEQERSDDVAEISVD